MSTIHEKLKVLLDRKTVRFTEFFFLRERLQYCLVCRMVCLDSDPTGLTCGRKECLAELLTLYFEQTELLEKILSEQILTDSLELETGYENLLLLAEQKLINLNAIKFHIAKQLGWNEDDIGSELEFLSQIEDNLSGDPEGDILGILGIVKKITQVLGIDPEGKTLRELLENIKDEIDHINDATEELTN